MEENEGKKVKDLKGDLKEDIERLLKRTLGLENETLKISLMNALISARELLNEQERPGSVREGRRAKEPVSR